MANSTRQIGMGSLREACICCHHGLARVIATALRIMAVVNPGWPSSPSEVSEVSQLNLDEHMLTYELIGKAEGSFLQSDCSQFEKC